MMQTPAYLPRGHFLAQGKLEAAGAPRLGADSMASRGSADSESMRAALDRSIASLGHVPGSFALAAADERTGVLCLARDASGSHGLYFHHDEHGRVHYASRLNLLLAELPEPPRISADGLAEYLRFLDITAPQTIYDGVFAVPPGQAVLFERGRCSFIELDMHPDTPLPGSYAEALDCVEQRIRSSIHHAAQGVRSPAAFLSGGVDSALLCALGRPVVSDAITLGFDDSRYDESGIASSVATSLGMRHTVLRPSEDDFFSLFMLTHGQSEQPFCDPAAMATRFAFDYCTQRYDLLIDGTGAEILPGSMPARWRRWAYDYTAWMPRRLRQGLARLPGLRRHRRLFDYDDQEDLFIRWQGFHSAEIKRLTGHATDLAHTRFYRTFRMLRSTDHLRRWSILQGTLLPDDRIRQASSASGLPCAHPFLDASVGPLMAALPRDWCHAPGRPKRLLRDILGRHVPSALWEQPKHGFEFDFCSFMRRNRSRLTEPYLIGRHATLDRLLSPVATRQVFDDWCAGNDALSFRVWALLILSAWLSHGPLVTDQLNRSR